jgi:hypothetical protein
MANNTSSLKNYNFARTLSYQLGQGSPCNKLFNDMLYFRPRYIMIATVLVSSQEFLKAYNN